MRRDESIAILTLPTDQAVDAIMAPAEKAEKYDQLCDKVSPTTPSGIIPMYLKPHPARTRKRPGRKKGHEAISRIQPKEVNHFKERAIPKAFLLLRNQG